MIMNLMYYDKFLAALQRLMYNTKLADYLETCAELLFLFIK
jgi:hypothetical protein